MKFFSKFVTYKLLFAALVLSGANACSQTDQLQGSEALSEETTTKELCGKIEAATAPHFSFFIPETDGQALLEATDAAALNELTLLAATDGVACVTADFSELSEPILLSSGNIRSQLESAEASGALVVPFAGEGHCPKGIALFVSGESIVQGLRVTADIKRIVLSTEVAVTSDGRTANFSSKLTPSRSNCSAPRSTVSSSWGKISAEMKDGQLLLQISSVSQAFKIVKVSSFKNQAIADVQEQL